MSSEAKIKLLILAIGIAVVVGIFACAHLLRLKSGYDSKTRCVMDGVLIPPTPSAVPGADRCYTIYCYRDEAAQRVYRWVGDERSWYVVDFASADGNVVCVRSVYRSEAEIRRRHRKIR